MKNKKAQVEPMQVVIAFVILAVVAVIIIFVFNTQFGKEKNITQGQINALGDSDKDGVPDFTDKCPNVAGKIQFEGCLTQNDLNAATGTT